MKLYQIAIKKLILTIVLISILITFFATPVSNAALNLKEGEFYYSGTTEGAYKPTSANIFGWILDALGNIADWILGTLTMGIRMAFVGWTALIEKLLTWGLETTTGIRADGSIVSNDEYGVNVENRDGKIDVILESPTDLSSVTDSSNNVTVEAIVYNKVVALNADIFNPEFDRTLSATGHKLVCKKCEKYTDDKGLTRYKPKYVEECCSEGGDAKTCCSCGGCDACVQYLAQLEMDEPVIFQLRNTVAMWYYIIRLLAAAIMLVVLIFVGIKMAISTIASDKAVYKRMFVDWVIGMILIFSLHYFMVFVVNLNSIMVSIIEESAKEMNKSLLELAVEERGLDIEDELSSKDLEIIIYDEIRTRAYDAKLSNGVIGMIMYMALVYLAVKFTVIYIKRLLTIMVLTLMAPGIGVAYALQRVLSGKSHALKTWLTEYIMNVIIQIVHALIYAVFISQALILSLTTISGMIIALILMNYTSKAEELFKKIFKFGGKDSLLGHTDNAMESLKENMQTAKAVVTGTKPAAKILANTPYAKALKGVGKAAVGAAIVHASNHYKTPEEKEDRAYQRKWDKEYNNVEAEYSKRSVRSDSDAEKIEMHNEVKRRLEAKGIIDPKITRAKDEALTGTPKKDLEQALAASKEKVKQAEEIKNQSATEENIQMYEAAVRSQEEAKANLERYEELTTLTTRDIIRGHKEKLLDIDNHFNQKRPTSIFDLKTRMENYYAVSDQLFGSVYFDKDKMKYVRNNDGQLTSENLLGLSKEDKKMLKEEILAPITKGFLGVGSLFVGMGTIVTEPKVGMGLLAMGIPTTYKTFHRGSVDNKKYKFSRFSAGAVKKMSGILEDTIDKQQTKETAERIKKKRKGFAERFKSGDIKAVTVGVAFAPVIAVGYTAKAAMHPVKSAKAIGHTGAQVAEWIKSDNKMESIKDAGKSAVEFSGNMAKSTIELIENSREETAAKFRDVGSRTRNLGSYAAGRFTRKMGIFGNLEKVENSVVEQRKKIDESIREDTAKLIGMQEKAEMDALVASEFAKFDQQIREDLENQGYDYNPITRIKTRKDTVGESDLQESEETKSKPNDRVVDSMLEEVLNDFETHGKLDFSSKSIQRQAIDELTSRLKKAKVISETEDATVIFKGGEASLVKTMKGKAIKREKTKRTSKDALEKLLTDGEIKIIQDATRDAKKDETVESVLEKISGQFNPTGDGSRKASGSEGESKVDSSKSGDRRVVFSDSVPNAKKKNAIVAQYVSSMISREKVQREDSKALRSKKKVAEALSAVMLEDSDGTTENASKTKKKQTLEDIMKTASKETAISEVKKQYGLTDAEATSATSLLEKLLEMKKMNQVAIGDYNMKKGSKEYVKARADKSSLAIEVSYLEQQKTKMEDRDARLGDEIKQLEEKRKKIDAEGTKGKSSKEISQERERIEAKKREIVEEKDNLTEQKKKIEERIPAKKKELLKSEKTMQIVGPTVNINTVLKSIESQAGVSKKKDGSKKVGGDKK